MITPYGSMAVLYTHEYVCALLYYVSWCTFKSIVYYTPLHLGSGHKKPYLHTASILYTIIAFVCMCIYMYVTIAKSLSSLHFLISNCVLSAATMLKFLLTIYFITILIPVSAMLSKVHKSIPALEFFIVGIET